jgi:hypothetical protein
MELFLLFNAAVESLGRFCSWLVSRFASNHIIENDVLHFMAEDPYWHSADNVWSKTNREGAKFPNVWRKWRIEEVLRDLWKRGLLERVRSKPKYYRIRFG